MTQIDEYDDSQYLGAEPEDYDDYIEELDWNDIPVKCNACFGTGLDRFVDADCINCIGEGYV